MKFKYSAFTDNTPEMREWLLKLGYVEDYWLCAGERPETPYLVSTFQGHFAELDEPMLSALIKLMMGHHDMVHSCCDKPELFKAIAAVPLNPETTTDQFQYFSIAGKVIGMCKCQSRIDMWGDFEPEEEAPRLSTIAELQEYFKIKEPCEN